MKAEWVSVTDKLPADETPVVVVGVDSYGEVCCDKGRYLAKTWGCRGKRAFSITHWIEFPKLPETPGKGGAR